MALSIQDISTEYLPVLENLMIEYFHPAINCQRKDEIKQIVNNFARQSNSWCYAIKFICESKSDYTKVYCFSVLHNFILRNWSALTEQMKNELKDYICSNLIKSLADGSHSLFIQNKFCQIIATIVHLSYPNFWPNYFDDLVYLISNPETMKLGIRLLNITLEELIMTDDDVYGHQKTELTRSVSNQVPKIVNLLSTIMRGISDKYLGSVFFTPSASPIESSYCLAMQEAENTIQTTNNKQINLKFICMNMKNLLENIDSESLEILELILRCEHTLFNWLSINDFFPLINETMLELLYIFATFGFSNGNRETKIGILTLTCINELLSKNYIYNESSSKFYFSLFDIIIKILHIIDTEEIDLENLDNEYLQKFIDSIRCFVINQITHKGQTSRFFTYFLEKFFQMTFKPKWNKLYQQLIEIWINLVDTFFNSFREDFILEKITKAEFLPTEFSFVDQLFKETLIKLQYRFNYAQLKELNDEYDSTELQTFFNCNFELLSKIAQLIPNRTQKIVSVFFDELVPYYLAINQWLDRSFSREDRQIKTEFLSVESANLLDYVLKDLITLIRVWQRLSEHFIGANYESSLVTVQKLIDQILECLNFSNNLKLFTFRSDKQMVVQDLNELHQSLLLFLKFYGPWINQYRTQSAENDEQNKIKLSRLLTSICDESVKSIMIALDEQDQCDNIERFGMLNEMIIQSSLLCLLTVSCSIKPKFLIGESSIRKFYDKLYSSLNKETCTTCLIFNEQNRIEFPLILKTTSCSNCKNAQLLKTLPKNKCTLLKIENQQELIWIDTISNILLLPWSQTPENEQYWEKRSQEHKKFVYAFYGDLLRQFNDQPSSLTQLIPADSQIGNTLKRTLFLLTNLVNNHVESPSKSKQLLLVDLIEFLEFSITILPANILNDSMGESLLTFLISVLEVFRAQVKLPFIEQIIKTLFDCISQNGLAESNLAFKNSLVEKVFKIFTFVVEQPAASFKIILPNLLDLALDRMYQAVIHSNCNDLYSTFYEFLYKFLLNNSKFFFKSQISSQFLGLSNSSNPDQTSNQQYFFRIFEVFGNSFITADLNLFKQNLVALDALNYRQKLFHKPIFRQNLLSQFMSLFLQTMINNEHKILQDELTSIMYSLASVDSAIFRTVCLSESVRATENIEYNCPALFDVIEDAPTFNKNLIAFIRDIRLHKSSNFLLV